MIARQTALSKNIVLFCRHLRYHNFNLTVEDEAAALTALQLTGFTNQDIFQLTLKTVFCKSRNELNEFDPLFNEYWKELGKAIDSKVKSKPALSQGAQEASFKSLKSWLNGHRNEEIEQTASYSFHESLSKKDFSTVPADELDELMRSVKALSRRLAAHLYRRYEKSNKIDLPDLRRTLRKNIRQGGELIEIAFRKPKRNRTKLVILCDVSKSMDLYAKFLLQFMYSFQQVYRSMETFAFSTHLQHITKLLKEHDFTTALNLLSSESNQWSGGTRIGESLHEFVHEHRHVLSKRTVVMIVSDGWDTGDIPLLKQSMEAIHKYSKKVIWLNPLAGYTDYHPDVAGISAAMPYIDVFAPVHNVESLKQLEVLLW